MSWNKSACAESLPVSVRITSLSMPFSAIIKNLHPMILGWWWERRKEKREKMMWVTHDDAEQNNAIVGKPKSPNICDLLLLRMRISYTIFSLFSFLFSLFSFLLPHHHLSSFENHWMKILFFQYCSMPVLREIIWGALTDKGWRPN